MEKKPGGPFKNIQLLPDKLFPQFVFALDLYEGCPFGVHTCNKKMYNPVQIFIDKIMCSNLTRSQKDTDARAREFPYQY